MQQYCTTHLVKGEDLNHHGTLFAARAAAWFVEAAFVAAASEHGKPSEIVCRNLHGMSFKIPVKNGTIVQFTSRVVYTGKSSIMVYVSVADSLTGIRAVDGFMTFVTVNEESGVKISHQVKLDVSGDEEESRIRLEALCVRKENIGT